MRRNWKLFADLNPKNSGFGIYLITYRMDSFRRFFGCLTTMLFLILSALVNANPGFAFDEPKEGENCDTPGWNYDSTRTGGDWLKCLTFKDGKFFINVSARESTQAPNSDFSEWVDSSGGTIPEGKICRKLGLWGWNSNKDYVECVKINGILKYTSMTTTFNQAINKGNSVGGTKFENGAKCSIAGEIKKISGEKFVCAKSSGKLIWTNMGGNSANSMTESKSSVCNPNLIKVKVAFGQDKITEPGFTFNAIVLENPSNCKISVYLSAGAQCLTGDVIEENAYVVPIQTQLALGSRQKIVMNEIQAKRYFPAALLQCQNLTGYRSTVFRFATNQIPKAAVLSAN